MDCVLKTDVLPIPASTPVAGTRSRHATAEVGSRIGDAGIELGLAHAAAAVMIRLFDMGATTSLLGSRARMIAYAWGLFEQASEDRNKAARQLKSRCRSGSRSTTDLPTEQEHS